MVYRTSEREQITKQLEQMSRRQRDELSKALNYQVNGKPLKDYDSSLQGYMAELLAKPEVVESTSAALSGPVQQQLEVPHHLEYILELAKTNLPLTTQKFGSRRAPVQVTKFKSTSFLGLAEVHVTNPAWVIVPVNLEKKFTKNIINYFKNGIPDQDQQILIETIARDYRQHVETFLDQKVEYLDTHLGSELRVPSKEIKKFHPMVWEIITPAKMLPPALANCCELAAFYNLPWDKSKAENMIKQANHNLCSTVDEALTYIDQWEKEYSTERVTELFWLDESLMAFKKVSLAYHLSWDAQRETELATRIKFKNKTEKISKKLREL